MRILHIMAGRGLGGAETYSTDVMLSLHKAGVDQCIVMSDVAPRFAEMKQEGLRMAPEILAFPLRPVQRYRLKNLIRTERPDIIQCWMRRAASLLPVTRIPTIGWFGGYYDPRHFSRCRDFVGVTKDIVAHMIKKGVAEHRAHFIPTFPDIVPSPPVDRATLATPPDVPVILALSRLHPKKGLDTLLQALKDLPECYAWLAGDGPLRRELEQLAKSLGVMERVRFLGWRTDRAALLAAADICVLPSRYEPFGTVILEAWAARKPFIACRSAGPAAHVIDGENGLLVEIDDAKGLAEALRRMITDDILRRRVINNGYQTYTGSYTREAVTARWMDFYRDLMEGQP